MKTINVIVPIYKGENYIDGLIHMFDRSSEILQQVHPDVKVQMSFFSDSPELELSEASYFHPEQMSCAFINPGIHQGIHATRIYGLKHTSSDFVLFFDQDDLVEPNYLLYQYEKIGTYDGVVCNGYYRGNRLIYSNSRPMHKTFDRKALLEKSWNPLSPGQVLLRRNAIPLEQWSKYILKHNLADDWLLWFLMVHNNCHFNLNPEVLYTHCENGNNSSQNWDEMGQSRKELLGILKKLNVLTTDEEKTFQERTEKYLDKYEKYINLDKLLDTADKDILVKGIQKKTTGVRVSIYGMGVYGQKMIRLLTEAGITVYYGIDQHAGAIQNSQTTVYGLDKKKYPQVDLIIVTALFAYDEVVNNILKDIPCRKIRMDEFISNCLRG